MQQAQKAERANHQSTCSTQGAGNATATVQTTIADSGSGRESITAQTILKCPDS